MRTSGPRCDNSLVISPNLRASPFDHGATPPAGPSACAYRAAALEPRRHSALFWGASGTILSVVGWVGLLVFEQYSGYLSEVHGDLKHFNELSADLVSKESLHRLVDRIAVYTKELQASNAARAALVRELQSSERSRRVQARELQQLRERLASVEGRQTAPPLALPVPKAEP